MSEVVVVFGASGDLAKKKTFPSLYNLVKHGWKGKIIGYARSKLSEADFYSKILENIKDKDYSEEFKKASSYKCGQYDKDEDFKKLADALKSFDKSIFYLALPPNVFGVVSEKLDKYCRGKDSIIIIEKPFGKDLESCRDLLKDISNNWKESETYRIDHFLGKEMVKNLIILRFANSFFQSMWSCNYIDNVQIVLKESFGTEGRGGYFDEYGIIRDVVQNHLIQLLTVVCMENPESIASDDIRDAKVKVLRRIPEVEMKDTLLGQYCESENGEMKGYIDDDTVRNDSLTATYSATTLWVNNERWNGILC
eukprot:NODE_42_length_34079_cov_0.552619.p4 type:complete len:309 gc:universal NODE_42_length_34079_cov_0.552619:8076-7150(-)